MTIEQLQARLHALHAQIGGEGHFCLAIDQDPSGSCHLTHWLPPTDDEMAETWRRVGAGTISECLAALERYAKAYRHRSADTRRPAAFDPLAGRYEAAAE